MPLFLFHHQWEVKKRDPPVPSVISYPTCANWLSAGVKVEYERVVKSHDETFHHSDITLLMVLRIDFETQVKHIGLSGYVTTVTLLRWLVEASE